MMTTVFVLMVLIGQTLGTPVVLTTEADCQAAGQQFLTATHGAVGDQKVGFHCSESKIATAKPETPPG